jgi:nucleoside-diphosphate-sugar epimerase
VLDLAERAGTRRLLLASTGAVYGPAVAPSRETDAFAPLPAGAAAVNAAAKREAEALAADLVRRRPELAAGLARGFAFVGPYLPGAAGFAAYDFLQAVRAGRAITIQGDGTAVRSYLYGADLAVWLWTILLRTPAGQARAWNVGAEEPVTIRELAERVANTSPSPLPLTVVGRPTAGRPPHVYLPDTSRARTELKLRARIPLAEALAKTAAWWPAGN